MSVFTAPGPDIGGNYAVHCDNNCEERGQLATLPRSIPNPMRRAALPPHQHSLDNRQQQTPRPAKLRRVHPNQAPACRLFGANRRNTRLACDGEFPMALEERNDCSDWRWPSVQLPKPNT